MEIIITEDLRNKSKELEKEIMTMMAESCYTSALMFEIEDLTTVIKSYIKKEKETFKIKMLQEKLEEREFYIEKKEKPTYRDIEYKNKKRYLR